MLAIFRRILSSKLSMALLALVVLAFMLAGVFTRQLPGSGPVAGPTGDSIATVGSRAVGVAETEQRIQQQFQQYAQQQPGLSMAAFILGGGYQAIVDQSIAAVALEQFARSIGLTVGKRQVDGEIASVPAFQGAAGRFDPATFQAVLAQQHLTEQQVRAEVAGDILRRMIYLPATGAVKLPSGLISPYAALLIEQRQGTIGFVPTSAFAGGAQPTDAELTAFYKSHIAAYTTPERRVLRYAVVGRDQVAAAATPTEAEIRQVYDSHPDKYAARETREIKQVVLDSEAKAKAFEAALASGRSFEEAALADGFTPGDIAIGEKTQAQYAAQTTPAIAQAVFALGQGKASQPIKGALGWYVVKVAAVKKVPATPFAQARPQIAADLAKQKQDAALAKLVNGIEDALSNGQSLADVAKADGLTIAETPPLTMSGLDPDQPGYKPAAEVQPLLQPAFQTSPDQPPSVQTLQQGERYAVLAVPKVVPATPIPLAQVKPRVTQDFLAARAADRAHQAAQAIERKVAAGTPMAQAFAAAPTKLPPPQQGSGRRIDFARSQAPVPPQLRTLFTMAVGGTKLVPAGDGRGWFLVHLDKTQPGDPKLLPALVGMTQGDMVQSVGNEYLEELSHAAEGKVGVTRNEKAIADLRTRLLGGAPAAP